MKAYILFGALAALLLVTACTPAEDTREARGTDIGTQSTNNTSGMDEVGIGTGASGTDGPAAPGGNGADTGAVGTTGGTY